MHRIDDPQLYPRPLPADDDLGSTRALGLAIILSLMMLLMIVATIAIVLAVMMGAR